MCLAGSATRNVLERECAELHVPAELSLALRVHLDRVDGRPDATVRRREKQVKLLRADHTFRGSERQVVPASLRFLSCHAPPEECDGGGDGTRLRVPEQDAHADDHACLVRVVDHEVERRALVEAGHVVLTTARQARLGLSGTLGNGRGREPDVVTLLTDTNGPLEEVDREAGQLRLRALGKRHRDGPGDFLLSEHGLGARTTAAAATAAAAADTALIAIQRAVLGEEPTDGGARRRHVASSGKPQGRLPHELHSD